MKIYRLLLLILIVVLMFSFGACLYIPASYSCDSTAVESVQIVELGKWDEEVCEYRYTVLVDIVDHSVFVERLNNLKDNDFFFIFGTPDGFFEGDIIIKVNYFNGDYDLIKRAAQVYFRSGVTQGGNRVTFDNEQFNALIDDFLTETNPVLTP